MTLDTRLGHFDVVDMALYSASGKLPDEQASYNVDELIILMHNTV